MKNKKNILFVLAVSVVFWACENIPLAKRTVAIDSSAFVKPTVVIDFTGVLCSNCPDAAKKISEMHEVAGDKLISVAMYPDCSFNHAEFDLRCAEATQYYETFGDLGKIVLPSGMVDFAPYNGVSIIDVDLWGTAVIERISKAVPLDVTIEASLAEASSRTVNIKSTVTTLSEINTNISLIYWLIEDDIEGTQNYHGQMISDYKHQHVLRTAINGLWGESISVSPSNGNVKESSYTAAKADWKLENCSVIGVIIDSDTKEIITAGKTKITIP